MSVGVWVTKHAIDQMRTRHLTPENKERDLQKMAWAEVKGALEEGRVAKNLPRWAISGRGDRWKLKRGDRYVWPQDKTRCYVITPHRPKSLRASERDGEFKQCWTIVTVVGPRPGKETV